MSGASYKSAIFRWTRTADGERHEGVRDKEYEEEGEDKVCGHIAGLIIVVVGHIGRGARVWMLAG